MTAHKLTRSTLCLLLTGLTLTLGVGASQAFTLWPFKKKATPPPQAVEVLGVQSASGAAPSIAQFWERNTLVIDLQMAGGAGQASLTRPADGRWPARISFRSAVAQFAVLEVRGAQRAILPLRAEGASPVTLPLDHSVWTQNTPQLEISWGAAALPTP